LTTLARSDGSGIHRDVKIRTLPGKTGIEITNKRKAQINRSLEQRKYINPSKPAKNDKTTTDSKKKNNE